MQFANENLIIIKRIICPQKLKTGQISNLFYDKILILRINLRFFKYLFFILIIKIPQ